MEPTFPVNGLPMRRGQGTSFVASWLEGLERIAPGGGVDLD
jgi:hypothetical protein